MFLLEVIDECTAALEIEPESVKALFRRGQAQLAIGELRLARSDLVAAAKAEPKNKEAPLALFAHATFFALVTFFKQSRRRKRQKTPFAFFAHFTFFALVTFFAHMPHIRRTYKV